MAQKRRKDLMEKRRQQRITLLCIAGGIGAVLLSVLICLIVFDIRLPGDEEAAPEQTAIPYDASLPFSLSDLTGEQLQQLRTQGSLRVSDGPRGISVGDSLDLLLTRYPSSFTQKQADSDQTGEQSDEEIILYCADYFENQNGVMTALPPRGLLSVDTGKIIVTLLAPTSAYPAGTLDNYGSYEHVYCRYTIDPDTMTISSIVLGIDQ
ncbi:MAG: hypothetical protein PUH70_11450 [Clostridiales bacterium]|nr:hypothetical protein [Clostridiales bacterium]MDY5350221.1 hypothetical protein [Candidatus Ventricola sp.]